MQCANRIISRKYSGKEGRFRRAEGSMIIKEYTTYGAKKQEFEAIIYINIT